MQMKPLEVLELSGMRGDGLPALLDTLVKMAKPEPWLYSEGVVTNRTPEEQACEITREKVFQYLNQVDSASLLHRLGDSI